MRYVTCFGNDLFLDVFRTQHPELLEKVFKSKFSDYCVCCELYKIEGKQLYKDFLNVSCTKTDEELEAELGPSTKKSDVREAFKMFLEQCGLDYMIKDDYNISNCTTENYHVLINNDSESLKSILETIKSMPQEKIKFKFRRAVINTLYTLIIIRRYIELTESVDQFKTAKTISVRNDKKKELAQMLVTEDGEMYFNVMKYVFETKQKTIDVVKGSNTIQKIIYKTLKLKSYARKGSHRKGYITTHVIEIDV